MFSKLKNKLKEWANKVSEVEEKTVNTIETHKIIIEEEGLLKKIFSKNEEINVGIKNTKDKKIIDKKSKEELDKDHCKGSKKNSTSSINTLKKSNIYEKKPKAGFFKKFLSSKKIITKEQFMDYSEDLEMILLENNVALEVSDKIIEELKNNIVGIELNKKEIKEKITSVLKDIIESVLIEPFNIIKEIKNKNGPYIMIFCGINGVGKTTSIAKFANILKINGLTSVMAASDTFRAAAIEQLKAHGKKLNIKVISHEYGSDPAAVGFDAIKYAKKNNINVVLIDTAGRIHTATNLLQEMAKIKRVCNPDRTIFLGESITGNDAVDQVKAFNEHIGIDGIILSKADIDEKGGTALSVGYITQKPILFLGTGQNYSDIESFDKKKFIEKLGL